MAMVAVAETFMRIETELSKNVNSFCFFFLFYSGPGTCMAFYEDPAGPKSRPMATGSG